MGDKAAAKRLMTEAGVPLLPGYQGTHQDTETLLAEAEQLGVPVMVKAAAGGGGKGMRLVTDPADLRDAIDAARREAMGAFGSDELILERALLRPRHVEIQVIADEHGTTLWLGERDCSIQRRHQKIVEEAPSPAVDDDLRRRMGEAAVAAAEAVDYVNAGTVEFLLDLPAGSADRGQPQADESGNFWFLEMNTRLQVEHPVTELVTGLDLVALQLEVAQGHPLPLAQDDVRIDGHAIEVRLYAEDPANDFLPATGAVVAWEVPDDVRVDTGIATGSQVTANYDPMIAKVIARGDNRDHARRRLARALGDTTVLGLRTNRGFLIDVLEHELFDDATTAFIAESGLPADHAVDPADAAAVAAILHDRALTVAASHSPGLAGWDSRGAATSRFELAIHGDRHSALVVHGRGATRVMVDELVHDVRVVGDIVEVNGTDRTFRIVAGADPGLFHLRLGRRDLDVVDLLRVSARATAAVGEGVLLAPMHGAVTDVLVEPGQQVAAGDKLVILEAMKMEHAIIADIDGTVAEVNATKGQQVAADAVLVMIDAVEGTDDE
jgi:geranyl-CoA carboxylase alpha subunit